MTDAEKALAWFEQWRWVSGSDAEKHSETIKIALKAQEKPVEVSKFDLTRILGEHTVKMLQYHYPQGLKIIAGGE